MRTFYVCSYGGCGSKMLCAYLNNFGKTRHIHSKNPPNKLTYIHDKSIHDEWFNLDKEIPENELENYTVIYIYKNPIDSIYSRFLHPGHLYNIQSDTSIRLEQVIDSGKDLYGIYDFFNAYTKPCQSRNYKIYCIKYEEFFQNIEEFNRILKLPDKKNLYPREKITKREKKESKKLFPIYKELLDKMEKMNFIEVI
jgi:hypothetical protein